MVLTRWRTEFPGLVAIGAIGLLMSPLLIGWEPVGDDPDVLAYDPGWQRLYVATEGGGLWVYRVDGRRLVAEGVLDLPHAHTVFDEPSCMIYVQASILITNRFGHFSSLVMTLPVRTHQLAIQPLKQLLAAPWEAHVASEPEMWNRIIGAFRIGPRTNPSFGYV